MEAEFYAAYAQGFPQGFPPEPPPASPTPFVQDSSGSSLPGSSQAGPSTLPFGRPTHECQAEILSVHFAETVAGRVFNSLHEMGFEMDEHRLNAFVGGQLCAAPRPLKEIIVYVNQYVSEILWRVLLMARMEL